MELHTEEHVVTDEAPNNPFAHIDPVYHGHVFTFTDDGSETIGKLCFFNNDGTSDHNEVLKIKGEFVFRLIGCEGVGILKFSDEPSDDFKAACHDFAFDIIGEIGEDQFGLYDPETEVS